MENGEAIESGVWLTKDEAAALLGVHPRQVERREAGGQIRKKALPREPGQTTARVVYSRADLLAVKAGTPNDYRRAGSVPGANALTVAGSYDAGAAVGPGAAALETLAAVLQRIAPAVHEPNHAPRPWLTLEEAAEYSGLPAAWLLRNAKEAYVGAIDLGGRPRGGRWRFRRDELANIGR
jgi:hypothetical protein